MISGTAFLHHSRFNMASTKNITEAMNEVIVETANCGYTEILN